MKYLIKFNESVDIYSIDWEKICPDKFEVIKDNKTIEFKLGNIMKNFDLIQVTYSCDTSDSESDIWGSPDTLGFDIYFEKPIGLKSKSNFKILIDITYGDLVVSEFSIVPPNKLSVIQYTSYHSKFDWSDTSFAFSEESLKDLIELLNKFTGIEVDRSQFNFLDNDPNTYYP